MSIYINDTKKQTVRHYYTTPKIEKAIETLLNEMEDIVSSETYEGIEVVCQEIPDYRLKKNTKNKRKKRIEDKIGEQIDDLEKYDLLTKVITLQKGTKDWYEEGEIVYDSTKQCKVVSVYDAINDLSTHDVFLYK